MPGQETVFISYRRADSAAQAQQLCDSLAALLRKETVYFDKDMRPGTDFPNEISAAIARAKAVLIIIGPGWLDDMKARESHPNKTDWVLEEVQAALARLQRGDKLLIVPMLLGGAPMPAQDEPKLPAALKELWRVNATNLEAQSRELAASSGDYALLALLLDAGVRRFMGTEDAEALLALGKKVDSLLSQPHMMAISSEWSAPPVKPSLATDIPASIVELANALKACAGMPGVNDALDKPAVRATCQSLLTLLCTMATDLALSKQWHESAGNWVVPASHAGTAVGVAAAQLNATEAVGNTLKPTRRPPPLLMTSAAEQHPTFANVIDIGVAGIGCDATAAMQKSIWHVLGSTLGRDYPGVDGQALTPGDEWFGELKGAVRVAKLSIEPVVVTHQHDSVSPSEMPLREAAAQLGADYLAYGPKGINLTRFPPGEVNAARLKCQNAINQYLAT